MGAKHNIRDQYGVNKFGKEMSDCIYGASSKERGDEADAALSLS
jgi:hypothetical protein